jgi:hypothetical protein
MIYLEFIESKLDAVIFLLEELGLGSIEEDKDGLPKILVITDLNILRSFFISLIQKGTLQMIRN